MAVNADMHSLSSPRTHLWLHLCLSATTFERSQIIQEPSAWIGRPALMKRQRGRCKSSRGKRLCAKSMFLGGVSLVNVSRFCRQKKRQIAPARVDCILQSFLAACLIGLFERHGDFHFACRVTVTSWFKEKGNEKAG